VIGATSVQVAGHSTPVAVTILVACFLPGVARRVEGFTRFKLVSQSDAQKFSTSHFNVTDVRTYSEYLGYETETIITKSLQPNCEVAEEFCRYIWNSYISKRISATTFTDSFQDDPEFPQRPCKMSSQCGIEMGEELILLHWGTSSKEDSQYSNLPTGFMHQQKTRTKPRIFVTTAITFQGEELWNRRMYGHSITTTSVLRGDFTFTSPTVYIVHHPISMKTRNKGGLPKVQVVGTIRTAGTIAVNTTDIYTAHLMIPNATEWARSVARGALKLPFDDPPSTFRRINLTDLQDPVPASAYYSHNSVCWSAGEVCATITDGSFRPALYFHDRFWLSLFHGWLPEECGWPTVWDPVSTMTPTEDYEDPDVPRHGVADAASIHATTTAIDSSSDVRRSGIAMAIARETAYHISATRKPPAKETPNRV
jgi:hypothetical protein